MRASNASLFFRGVPTKIDVETLAKRYGVPSEGTEIAFTDAAKTIGIDVEAHRFRTVFSAWRRQLLRESNVLLVAIGGGKVRAAAPDERIGWASRKVASGRRAIGKAIVVAYQTDAKRLDAKKAETRTAICDLNAAKLRLAAGVMPK